MNGPYNTYSCVEIGFSSKWLSRAYTQHAVLIPHPRPIPQACSGAGEWRAALSILDDMQAEGLRPEGAAYVAAMEACARGGMMDLALELLDRVLQEHPGDETVGILIT